MDQRDNSYNQESSLASHSLSNAMFRGPLKSSRHIIRENHYVLPEEPEIHSTAHLEEVEGLYIFHKPYV